MQTLKEFNDKSSVFLFHLTTCSFANNTDVLEQLIQSCKTDFDIITVFKSRLINPGGTLI